MKSISLLGPAYRDRVFSLEAPLRIDATNFGSWHMRLGGIFNVARELAANYSHQFEVSIPESLSNSVLLENLSVHDNVKSTPVGETFRVESAVVLDVESAARTTLVDSGAIPVDLTETPPFLYSDVLHLGYLDAFKISDLCQQELRSRFDVIVCDLSSTNINATTSSQLRIVDALLCSSSEYGALMQAKRSQGFEVNLPDFICVHDPEYLLVVENNQKTEVSQSKFESVHTLGAGDSFAAFFLGEIADGATWHDAAVFANNRVREKLHQGKEVE